MGLGASASSKPQGKTGPSGSLEVKHLTTLQTEIAKLENATKDTMALDEYIEATQTYSNTSTVSRVPAVGLITDSVQKAISNLDNYFDDIDTLLENMRTKLSEFKEAVFTRCEHYSEDEKLSKLSRARQQISIADELILKAKGRLVTAQKDNKTTEMIKSLKRQVQDLELFKSDLESNGMGNTRSNKSDIFENVLQSEGGEYVIEDILKWRNEALKLRRKCESLLDDNEKLKTDSEKENVTLRQSNKKFIEEVIELRQESNAADEKVEAAKTRVQLVEEKLLDERLSHEVEINSLKAMLEKKDEVISKLMGSSKPVTPGPEQGQIRLSPEGIVGISDTDDNYKSNDSRSSSPEKELAIKKETDEVVLPYNDDSNEAFKQWISDFEQPETGVSETDKVGNKVNNTYPQSEPDDRSDDANQKKQNESADIKIAQDQTHVDKEETYEEKNITIDDHETRRNEKASVTEVIPESPELTENTLKPKIRHGSNSKSSHIVKENQDTKFHCSDNRDKTSTIDNETLTQDIIIYEEGTVKEIVYKRNDSEIDGNLSYHKGVGAVLQTCNQEFGVDSVSCEIIDELEIDMLPDFVEGERAVSFQLHFKGKFGNDVTLKDGESLKLFVPHRYIREFEEASLIQSVNGGDWEPCDPLDEIPASVDDVQMVCTELQDLTDVKLIAIAREKVECIIAGEGDVRHLSKYDQTVTINLTTATFRSRTEVKILVHDTHRREMLSAIEMHDECKQIVSCTPYVCLLCEQFTKDDFSVTMRLPEDTDAECKYTMFSLDDYGWTLADCDWLQDEKELVVHLRASAKKYRILGLELPEEMSAKEKLKAVKTLHDHTSHYLMRLLFRQREDDPSEAVVICLSSNIVKTGIHELKELGYSVGGYPSSQFCLLEGDTLMLQFSDEITANPVTSEKMEMTFYSQKEIATKQLKLYSPGAPKEREDAGQLQGCLSVIKKDDTEKIILGETINFQIEKQAESRERQKQETC